MKLLSKKASATAPRAIGSRTMPANQTRQHDPPIYSPPRAGRASAPGQPEVRSGGPCFQLRGCFPSHQPSMEERKGWDFVNLRRFVQSFWVSTLATPPPLVMIAQHSVRNSCAAAYAALQLSASRKPTVSLCGSNSTCSSVRAGFGARQCAALETAPVRSFVRCVRLGLGAYVKRLEELVLLVNHGVHRRLSGFEETFIGCGYLAQESNAGLTGQADADGESERRAIRGVSPSIMNTSDASTRVRSGFTQTGSIIFQSSIRASDQCAAVASES